jgi:predicted permease
MKRSDDDFKAEIEAHIALETDQLMADGLSAGSARDLARKKFGGIVAVQERFYESRRIVWIDHVRRDIRDAWRSLVQSPLTTVAIALSLAIGIGGDTAVFTIANGVLSRAPAGVVHPEELVDISREDLDSQDSFGVNEISMPNFLDLRTRTTTLVDVYAYAPIPKPVGLTVGGEGATRVYAHVATVNYFQVLGVQAAAGRVWTDRDRDRAVVLSHACWTHRFQQDPSVIGRWVRINGEPFAIAGVAAADFHGTSLVTTDVWMPFDPVPPDSSSLRRRDEPVALARGRLKPGVSVARAAAEVDMIGRALAQVYPEQNEQHGLRLAAASYLPGNLARPFGGIVVLITLFVSLVLAIACANLTSVLLARGRARQREIAVRIAIGAGRGHLVRQLLTETMLLFAVGAVAGVILAYGIVSLVIAFGPVLPIPRRGLHAPGLVSLLPIDVAPVIDWRVLLFTSTIALLAAIACGLAPAIQTSRIDPIAALKGAAASATVRLRVRHALVVMQVGLSIVLLAGAGIFIQSVRPGSSVNRGFDATRVDAAELDLAMGGYAMRTSAPVARDVLSAVRALPGATDAALTTQLPGAAGVRLGVFRPAGAPMTNRSARVSDANTVSPGYFPTLSIPILEGRDFTATDTDGAPLVAIVSEEAARRLWNGQSAIGKRLVLGPWQARFGEPINEKELLVIGVVGEVRAHADGREHPVVYLPLDQHPATDLHIVARARNGSITSDLRRAVTAVDPNVPVVSVQTLDDALAMYQWPQRAAAFLSASLGIVAIILVGIGIYGVMAYTVAARTREIGVRMALGAGRTTVLRMVLGHGLGLVAAGAAIGLVIAAAAISALRAAFFGLPAADLTWFGSSVMIVAIVGLVACAVPARRATSVDPVATLRCE